MHLRNLVRWPVVALIAAAIAAQVGAAEPVKSLTLFEAMKDTVVPKTQVIWDITNAAQDDMGNVTAKALKPGDWTKIANAAQESGQAMRKLLAQHRVIAAPNGKKIQGEGAPGAFGAGEVQQTIDANPTAFAAFGKQLLTAMDGIVAATKARNAVKVGSIAGDLDGICEACHKVFWYPSQSPPKK
jgi:cytochrome c556